MARRRERHGGVPDGATYAYRRRPPQGLRRLRRRRCASVEARKCGLDDLIQPFGRFQARKFGGREPARLGQFAVQQFRFAGDPARRERQDDEMPLGPAVVAADDDLAVAGQRDRLDRQAGFLVDLALDRLDQGFAAFDDTARQRIETVRRRVGAAHDQHAAVADDGGADGKKRPVGI